MPETVQVVHAKFPCRFVVCNHITGVQPGQIAVQQYKRIFLQLHGKELIAEKRLVLGKKDHAGNIRIQAAAKQIVLHLRVLAVEYMAQITVRRKDRQRPIQHSEGEKVF